MAHKEMKGIEETRRKRRPARQNEIILIPGLPTDLAIACMARVPRSHHHKMKRVCRSWRKLLHGTILSKVRLELSLAEEWFYLWISGAHDWHRFNPSSEKWFKLPPMPHDHRLPGYSGLAAFDGKLFVIGGFLLNFYNTDKAYIPCRTVSYFDGRSHHWKRAADLNIARAKCMAGVIQNQLYVFGGNIEGAGNRTITAEVYDPIINTWRFVSSMKAPLSMHDSVVLGGKFYAIGGDGAVYNAKMDKWEDMPTRMRSGWKHKATTLNGKLYTIVSDHDPEHAHEPDEAIIRIHVYNPSNDTWKIVATSDVDAVYSMSEIELVSIGGKLSGLIINAGEVELDSSRVYMGILEGNESTEDLACRKTFQMRFF